MESVSSVKVYKNECESQSLVSTDSGWYICYLKSEVFSVRVTGISPYKEVSCTLSDEGGTQMFKAMSEVLVEYRDENRSVHKFTTMRPLHVCIWTWASKSIYVAKEGL